VFVDFCKQLSYEEKAPIIEAQLKAWKLLDFPYEIQKLPTGDLVIYRLIDGIPTQQNEFNIILNESGEVGYLTTIRCVWWTLWAITRCKRPNPPGHSCKRP
jgi:hypothetical protein